MSNAMNQPLDAYAALGWKLVPVHREKRHPHYNGWPTTEFTIEHIMKDMRDGHGVGVQTGPASNWLIAADLDSHYARVCAPDFLPRTLEIAKEGEREGLSSLWIYYSIGARKIKVSPLDTKADKGAVVELLGAPGGQGRQFIVPPSRHPKKGSYVWVDGFDPERIVTTEAKDLERCVRHLGAAALIAEHLPDSGRHELSKALAGLMLRDDREDLETVESILESAWAARGGDFRAAVQNARDTAKNLAAGKKITGGKEVNKTVKGLAGKIADALGWEERDRPMTPEERKARADRAWAECKELAKSDDILSRVYALQQQDGLVGEERNAKIMQLASATRYMGRPMSVIVNGESSGGKSFLLKETLKTLPEEATHVLQSVSDKALAYIGENTLTDKFLLIYELGGLGKEGEQGIEMVKQLLTEGRIDRQIAESTGDGVRGRRVYAEGPTGLWTTTTKNAVDGELQNRALTLTIDESPHQTELIIKGRRNRKKRVRADFATVKALHTWLAGQRGDVDVPFEDVIADGVDTRAVRMRRFYDYIMELVEAHALLHRATRDTDADGFVLAKPEDYAAVYKLVKDIVAVAAEVAISDSLRETVEAARRVFDSHKKLTRASLAQELGVTESTASRRLGSATSAGYLKHDPEGKGKTKIYVTGDIQLPDMAEPAIPDPEEIWEAMKAAYADACKRATRALTPTPSTGDEILSALSRAHPDCTHRAHMDKQGRVDTEKPHRNGNSSEGVSGEKSFFGPHVHALHTCTHEETPSENGSVHPNVHTPVHASEGDADPLGERRPYGWRLQEDAKQWLSYMAVLASSGLPPHVLLKVLHWWLLVPPRRVQRWQEIYYNDPARYHELPIREKIGLRAWVRENVAMRQVTSPQSSYHLKHVAESFLGFYVSNASMKGALIEAGYEPVWEYRKINMGFRCGPKPRSTWAAQPNGKKRRYGVKNRSARKRRGANK